MAGKKRGKSIRYRSMKTLRRRRLKSRKYKSSKWKLNYPELFMEIPYFPYIVRRKKEKEKPKREDSKYMYKKRRR